LGQSSPKYSKDFLQFLSSSSGLVFANFKPGINKEASYWHEVQRFRLILEKLEATVEIIARRKKPPGLGKVNCCDICSIKYYKDAGNEEGFSSLERFSSERSFKGMSFDIVSKESQTNNWK